MSRTATFIGPLETTLHVIKTIRDMYPEKFQFHAEYFDKIMGTAKVRRAIEAGESIAVIVNSWGSGLAAFAELRRPYLIY